MIAVIRTGGKQYTVAPDDTLTIERIAGEAGAQVEFTDVLMVDDKVGAPTVAGAKVLGSIVKQARGPHLIVFKKRRRQIERPEQYDGTQKGRRLLAQRPRFRG